MSDKQDKKYPPLWDKEQQEKTKRDNERETQDQEALAAVIACLI